MKDVTTVPDDYCQTCGELVENCTCEKAVLYPEITVELTGEDGNAFSILGRVTRALRHAGVSRHEITAFRDEATSGDYNHLLRTVMRWVNAT